MNEKNDLAFVRHILDCINAIEKFSKKLLYRDKLSKSNFLLDYSRLVGILHSCPHFPHLYFFPYIRGYAIIMLVLSVIS